MRQDLGSKQNRGNAVHSSQFCSNALAKKSVPDNLISIVVKYLINHYARNFPSVLTKFQFQDVNSSGKIT